MAAARSGLESQVASIMRALRERGEAEREALAKRLERSGEGLPEKLPGFRRITSSGPDGSSAVIADGTVTRLR